MKLVAYAQDGSTRFAALDGTVARDVGTMLVDPQPGGAVVDLDAVERRPAVGSPGKIVCIGLNYSDHALEAGLPVPEQPLVFAKFASSLRCDGEPIRLPRISQQIDYEGELAVVIGTRVKAVPRDKALDVVFGYTCLNDVSARDLQRLDGQFVRAKSLDTFCPVGPCVVTADELSGIAEAVLTTRLNGEVVQRAPLSNMIFSLAAIIEFVSQEITLEPGDVIATGTPAGVGVAGSPPRFLRAGDVVEVDIDGIGTLRNPVEGP